MSCFLKNSQNLKYIHSGITEGYSLSYLLLITYILIYFLSLHHKPSPSYVVSARIHMYFLILGFFHQSV